MVSLVVFPFKTETPELVLANIDTAAANPSVDEVWAIASEPGANELAVRSAKDAVANARGKTVEILIQERLGRFRPGKGDGMNTAIALAAEQGRERVHFYDADITNFDTSWIDGAEKAADKGYGVVRHRFPRAATDAMITWMITRPALARLFPGTLLPRLNQPLGGEVLLTRPALEKLAGSQLVRERSDWGIDTVLTYATSVMGLGVYEHHVDDGKRHALYGSLAELRDMLLECLDAAASLSDLPGPSPGAKHASDPPAPTPADLKETIAYDVEGTRALLSEEWSREELDLVQGLREEAGAALFGPGETSAMDEELWHVAHGFLLENFVLGDPAWESVAFRLWLMRVLDYTNKHATRGFDEAMSYLESTIVHYEERARSI